jgi:deoxyadenosine/deoxycytidine kinase
MLIVVEGCIGAGKTTVTEGLAKFRKSLALYEDFAANPFLKAFYVDPVANALETEFGFLLLHFHQLRTAASDISTSEVVADFHLWKDLLYADLNLTDVRIKRLFNELYEILLTRISRPSLMIFLSASTDLIIDRIRGRQREFEIESAAEYFAGVNAAYEKAIASYPGRKLCLDMERWDFVRHPELFADLSLLLDRELES